MSKSLVCLFILSLLNPSLAQVATSSQGYSLYYSIVFFGSILCIACCWKRIFGRYVNELPVATLNFEPYKYYKPRNQLHITWTAKREVHTSGEIYTTNAYQSYGYGYGYGKAVPNVQGSISSEAVVIGYTVRITYDGATDIGDRMIRTEDIPNYLRSQEILSQVTAKTGVTHDGGCLRGSTYSNCLLDTFAVLSVFWCLCFFYLPFQAQVRGQNKKKYQTELNSIANERNNRHLAQLLEEADRVVNARVEGVNDREARQNAMGGNNNVQNGHVVLTMDQLQLLMQNAQGGHMTNIPGMNGNQNLMD